MAYQSSRIVVTSKGFVTPIIASSLRRRILGLFTAPQGPDVPVDLDPSQLPSVYGFAGASASAGFTGPFGLQLLTGQRHSQGNTSLGVVGCRVGVTRAGASIMDTSVTPKIGVTLQGIGAYAGSKGNNLAIQYTISGGQVTSVSVVDTSNSNTQMFTITSSQVDLSSYTKIMNAINGNQPSSNVASVVNATLGDPTALYPPAAPPAAPGTSMTGGLDGKGAGAGDATIATLLTASLQYPVDFIWAAFDGAAITATISAHLTAALAENSFRKAVLGPVQGTTYSALTGSYLSPMSSDRIQCVSNDYMATVDPIRGVSTIVDGFYSAAIATGIKAVGPARSTCKGQALAGIAGVGNTGLSTAPTFAQKEALATAGALVIQQNPRTRQFSIRDNITTAPFNQSGGQLNPFVYGNVRDVDDRVSNALVEYMSGEDGQARETVQQNNTTLGSLAEEAMLSVASDINGTPTIQTSTDPVSGKPQVNVIYGCPLPFGEIDINTGFVLA